MSASGNTCQSAMTYTTLLGSGLCAVQVWCLRGFLGLCLWPYGSTLVEVCQVGHSAAKSMTCLCLLQDCAVDRAAEAPVAGTQPHQSQPHSPIQVSVGVLSDQLLCTNMVPLAVSISKNCHHASCMMTQACTSSAVALMQSCSCRMSRVHYNTAVWVSLLSLSLTV